MHTTTIELTLRGTRLLPAIAVLTCLVLLLLSTSAMAQPTPPAPSPAAPSLETSSCLPPNALPTVPTFAPRPMEGGADGSWPQRVPPCATGTGQTVAPAENSPVVRQGKDAAPIASFVHPLQGNDAAIKLMLGQGRLLTLKTDIAAHGGAKPLIAMGDPSIADFEVLPPRMLRLVGKRAGTTDLSVVGTDGQAYGFEVQVLYDLELVSAHIRQVFPNSTVRLTQMRNSVVVEGEARSIDEIGKILIAIYCDLTAAAEGAAQIGFGGQAVPGADNGGTSGSAQSGYAGAIGSRQGESDGSPVFEPSSPFFLHRVKGPKIPIVNLLRVPGVHQVMLKVRVAELNRTALREIGTDMLFRDPSGNVIGTHIAGSSISEFLTANNGSLGPGTTAFGVFPSANFEIFIRALRQNSLLSIMAEPNLVAMSGMQASFLAGGQFPVPVPQSGVGSAAVITIDWKAFGVMLNFTPYVLGDDSIRLTVRPEVSTIDPSLGTVINGTAVPGINTRNANTTVEMRQGQTLAIAGLLQVSLDAKTSRIPGLGDLPYLGPLFSNSSHKRIEKELLVLVTPLLVAPMDPCQVPPLPGADIKDPTDCELYLKSHIEGHTDTGYRSTAAWDQPIRCRRVINAERNYVNGPVGFSQ